MKAEKALSRFAAEHAMRSKGPLCVALVVTRRAADTGLPLEPETLLADSRGQVRGLGKTAVQKILADHGITRTLAEEGGRTSRGSVGKMRAYVELLNDLHSRGECDLQAIEAWWVQQVEKYWAGKPLKLKLDPSQSMRAVISSILTQAESRQRNEPGATYVGTVLQHLVGAKLHLILGPDVQHRGASVADQPGGLPADFLIEDVAIHVTTAPSEALIRKCVENLETGLRPIIVTAGKGLALADGLAEQADIAARIDVFDGEQFLAGNLYELGLFGQEGRVRTAGELVEQYNQIVEECEGNPSLLIEMR